MVTATVPIGARAGPWALRDGPIEEDDGGAAGRRSAEVAERRIERRTVDRTAAPTTPLAETTRASLIAPRPERCPAFDPATTGDLPAPARRMLLRAIPVGAPLAAAIELTMTGELKLGRRWLPFTADQVLRAGVGFVWRPTVGGRFVRFSGADVLGPDGAEVDFRLHGRLPVVRASGPDVDRSARGRLAAETVAWLPQALTPQAGACWRAVDDHRAVVTIDAAGEPTEVEVTVDDEGQLRSLALERWKDSAEPAALAPFGGTVGGLLTTDDGVAIASQGTVGWDWGTTGQAAGVFFRYTIGTARNLR